MKVARFLCMLRRRLVADACGMGEKRYGCGSSACLFPSRGTPAGGRGGALPIPRTVPTEGRIGFESGEPPERRPEGLLHRPEETRQAGRGQEPPQDPEARRAEAEPLAAAEAGPADWLAPFALPDGLVALEPPCRLTVKGGGLSAEFSIVLEDGAAGDMALHDQGREVAAELGQGPELHQDNLTYEVLTDPGVGSVDMGLLHGDPVPGRRDLLRDLDPHPDDLGLEWLGGTP